jgi:hypothetical protein
LRHKQARNYLNTKHLLVVNCHSHIPHFITILNSENIAIEHEASTERPKDKASNPIPSVAEREKKPHSREKTPFVLLAKHRRTGEPEGKSIARFPAVLVNEQKETMKLPSHPCSSHPTIGNDSSSYRRSSHKRTAGFKRGREQTSFGSRRRRSWLVALAALAVSSSSRTNGSFLVLADDNESVYTSNDRTSVENNDTELKPYRPKYGGRIKLIPNRKIIRITTVDELTTTPWKKNKDRGSGDIAENRDSDSESPGNTVKETTPTLWTMIEPYVKRGLLLAALTAVAILDRSPPPSSTALVSSAGTTVSTSRVVSSWTNRMNPLSNLRLDWTKLYSLPGEILPTLSAALMIAWVPNLVLQKAWWELGFLVISLTSQSTLRTYMLTEVLPSLGGTIRKLFWSEFWKQAWDFLLEPFSSNIFLPPKPSLSSISASNNSDLFNKWQSEVSQFWSDRVISRIDKWTASSVKALLQKNVQASVNSIAEDSWNAVAYSWYPDGNSRNLQRGNLPLPSNEDTRRMVELECEDNDECEEGEDEGLTSTVNDKIEETLADSITLADESESTVNDEEEDSSDSSSSSILEDQDGSIIGDDPDEELEDPELILN